MLKIFSFGNFTSKESVLLFSVLYSKNNQTDFHFLKINLTKNLLFSAA
ncbi:hypothetical protein GCWU000323_01384 [Leptotrichia hofstadii F0254]|uniref:Uncharacterized protein n=1 Tax=Leptotrichia hofstadii F0254 TaxID=634994 RepID=C9MXW2_9FUSO|nr:hypothetical protein GCWU000323_01384 [Leptotrichia hofstadii F0254]